MPALSAEIVQRVRTLAGLAFIIRHHHERYEGSGYPDGLSREDIPVESRIISVADTFDALTSKRPYRPAMAHPECLRVMREDAAGGGLDRDLVEALAAELTESPA